jgi:hypothetical protein
MYDWQAQILPCFGTCMIEAVIVSTVAFVAYYAPWFFVTFAALVFAVWIIGV